MRDGEGILRVYVAEEVEEVVPDTPGEPSETEFPNLVGIARLSTAGQIDIRKDFEVGLDVILDSMVRIRDVS